MNQSMSGEPGTASGSLEKKLAAYALAGGAALLATSAPAQAAVIVVTPSSPITISVETGGGEDYHLLDMDSDGVFDFILGVYSAVYGEGSYTGQYDAIGIVSAGYSSWIAGIASGNCECGFYNEATRFTNISEALASNPTLFKAKLLARYTYDGESEFFGQWPNSLASNGLIGVNFLLGNTTPVQGFIDVSVEIGSASATIHQWGWQSTDVPEPSTMAMLALGAAGMAAIRRRRKQQAQ